MMLVVDRIFFGELDAAIGDVVDGANVDAVGAYHFGMLLDLAEVSRWSYLLVRGLTTSRAVDGCLVHVCGDARDAPTCERLFKQTCARVLRQ